MRITNLAPSFIRLVLFATVVIAAIAILFIIPGCGGNGSGGTGSAASQGSGSSGASRPTAKTVGGRVIYRYRFQLTPAQMANLTDSDRAAIIARGALIVGNDIELPDVPAEGHWIRIGSQLANTDADGRFGFSALPPDATMGGVYKQLTDTQPVQLFPVIPFIQPIHLTPLDIVIQLSGPLPNDMNPLPTGKGKSVAGVVGSCCTARRGPDGRLFGLCTDRDVSYCAGDNGPCCEDFNGSGDKKAYCRAPLACPSSYTNFIDSTCYQWVWGPLGTACNNEGALPWNSGGPSCYSNHKYRNCQNLDPNDFSVKAPDLPQKVCAGATVKIVIRNNTPSNETLVTLSPNSGSLSGDGFDATTGILKHYTDGDRTISVKGCPEDNDTGEEESGPTASITVGTHHVERTLTYTAPGEDQIPASGTLTVTVTGTAFSKNDSVMITVCKCKK